MKLTCKDCGVDFFRANRATRCAQCTYARARKLHPRCASCGEAIEAASVRTQCNRCVDLAKYGLTKADFAAMLHAQSSECGVCNAPITARGCVIDHNHKTGQVRALICQGCNQNVGTVEAGRAVVVPERVKNYLAYHG